MNREARLCTAPPPARALAASLSLLALLALNTAMPAAPLAASPASAEKTAGASNAAPAVTASPKVVPEAAPTVEIMAQFLEDYVARKASAGGGWFRLYDSERRGELALHLIKMHRERLTNTADKTFVACVDFTTAEGKLYDIDIWVNQTPHGLVVVDATIHKVGGVPRYIWMEQEDHWELVPV